MYKKFKKTIYIYILDQINYYYIKKQLEKKYYLTLAELAELCLLFDLDLFFF